MASLTITNEDGQGTSVELVADVCSIGRDERSDVRLDARNVSRRHAELRRRDDGAWVIVDGGSANGSSVNGARVDGERELCDGDVMQMGDCELRFDDPSSRRPIVVPPAVPSPSPTLTPDVSAVVAARASEDGVVVGADPSGGDLDAEAPDDASEPPQPAPRCRCGHERSHHMVSAEEEYSWFSALVIATGISQKPLRIRYKCRRCGETIGDPVERPLG